MCKHLAKLIDPMYRGAMPLASAQDIENLDAGMYEEPLALFPAQERRKFWDFLHQFKGVTQKQKHVLIRHLVDGAKFSDIGEELKVDRTYAHKIYKGALKRIKKEWKKNEQS